MIRTFDPRNKIAKKLAESSENYEEKLRSNPALKQDIVEAILKERNRILALFNDLMPDFSGRISIVVNNILTEYCSVFLWKNHIYVLVSAGLIGRPIDYPDNPGLKAWQWLARHEITHVRENHFPWLFYTRKIVNFMLLFVLFQKALSCFFEHPLFSQSILISYWVLAVAWSSLFLISLVFECRADLQAAASIEDSSILEDAEKMLRRMSITPKNFIGWMIFFSNTLFLGPHPPLFARCWLLHRRINQLKKEKGQLP